LLEPFTNEASFYIVPIHQVCVWTALSGTPGTGKTTVGRMLSEQGLHVVELSDFIKEHKLEGRMDRKRRTREVDVGALGRALADEVRYGDAILVGHLAHLLQVDLTIVLRCRPSVLKERLLARGYPIEKVRENMEAEGCDVILVEAVETGKTVLEVDTSASSPEQIARAIGEILAGEREKYAVGNIDWSEEVLAWF
jgi:adenylate kinase